MTITRETYVTTIDQNALATDEQFSANPGAYFLNDHVNAYSQKVTASTQTEEFDNIARFARIVRDAERPGSFANVLVQVYCLTFVNDVPGRMYGITNYCVVVDPVSADIDRVDIVRQGESACDDTTVAVRRFDVITDTILSR